VRGGQDRRLLMDAVMVAAIDMVDSIHLTVALSGRREEPAPDDEFDAIQLALEGLEHHEAAYRRATAWAAALRETLPVAGAADRPAHAAGVGLAALVWRTAEEAVQRLDGVRDQDVGLCRLLTLLSDELLRSTGQGWVPAAELVPRRRRYVLRAFFDPGAWLLWSDSEAARRRWDYMVDHRDLPVSEELAVRVDVLLERYERSVPLRGEHQPFDSDELRRFQRAYAELLADLSASLGPAYEIRDETRGSGDAWG